MDIRRIKQILNSPSETEVIYNGVSVWIDQVHEDGLATVHLRNANEERSEVDISELEEVVH